MIMLRKVIGLDLMLNLQLIESTYLISALWSLNEMLHFSGRMTF